MDYTNSQESEETLGDKIERITGKKCGDDVDKENENLLRRCDRLKNKEDVRVEDLARERAAAKDNYGNFDNLDVFNFPNNTLADMASMVGIDLGCSLDMIDTNLEIMRNLEQARRDVFRQNLKDNVVDMTSSSPVHIDTGDVDIEELLSNQENEKTDTEGLCFDDLRHIFSAKKNGKVPHQLWVV